MKRFLLLPLLVLCFNTICLCGCSDPVKTFYITYMENMLQHNSKNELLLKKYLSEGLLEKVTRVINATGSDPIIRAQDINSDAIETLSIKCLSKNWYMVSYYWNKKDDDTLIEVPINVQNIDGHCKITYITPIWNGSRYGDDLISCGDQNGWI
ncbi:MAG: hypothetical protein RR346_06555 [Bacteroidales bacterium]